MILVKALSILLSAAFLSFGYFIYFKKKYNLINGFEYGFKNGRKTENYALRVGLIEFIVSCILSIVMVLFFVFYKSFLT